MLSNVLIPVLASAAADFNARNSPAVMQTAVGMENVSSQDAANRIVLVLTGLERWDGPRKQTPNLNSQYQQVAGSPQPGEPRSLRTRFVRVEAHIWGPPPAVADPSGATYYDGVDALLRSLVIGLCQNNPGQWRALGGEYPKALGPSGLTQYGRVYVFHFEYEAAIQDQDVTTAQILSISQTNQLNPTLPAPGTPGS